MLPFVRNPEAIANPEAYFVDAENRSVPLVIEHATGVPAFAVVDGLLMPYDAWRAEHQRPAPSAPRGLALASGDGAFSASLAVS